MTRGEEVLLRYERRGRTARTVVRIVWLCSSGQALVQSERGGELTVPIDSLRPWTALDQLMCALDESEEPARVD